MTYVATTISNLYASDIGPTGRYVSILSCQVNL
jgi:hypothetical protein